MFVHFRHADWTDDRTGMGRFIEQYYRTVPFDAVLGGAEDVLGDLGVRQAMKQMPKNVKL